MPETYLTRGQWAQLNSRLHYEFDSMSALRDWLASIGIQVEDDQTVGDDVLSASSINRLAHANGCHIAVDISSSDIAEEYPWLHEAEADSVAWDAADTLSENSNVSESKGYAIDHALERAGFPTAIEEGTWTDAHGVHWTPVQYMEPNVVPTFPMLSLHLMLWCSDGRVFEQDGRYWRELNDDEIAIAVAIFTDRQVEFA